ncbi:ABC transporter permease [Listeria aquatica]|uniref:ABC transporter permease n=1 Tax=Listeria aquatica TaxID=1494960 RepID=UPI0031F55458
MTLYDLARKNIKHNFIHYFLYFASMSFSIMIYYTLVVLSKDPTVTARINRSERLSAAFTAASIILLIFIIIFILYSNNFFMRKRKKEIGLYNLLGLRKFEISRMLFYENFIMGIGSLVIGIILGTFLSKLFVAILLRLMNDALPSRFIFSWSAVINASLVFVLVTLITSLLSFWTIYRNSLLDLFHSEAKREKALKPSLLWTCIALTFIITGYVIALQPLTVQNSIWSILGVPLTSLLILFFTIVGTVLFISFFLPYFLKKLRTRKASFYRGTNLVTNAQLSFRISSNAKTLSVIAILSAITLSAIGAIGSVYYNINQSVQKEVSTSFEYTIPSDSKKANKALAVVESNPSHPVTFKQATTIYLLKPDKPTKKINDVFLYEDQFQVMSESQYKRLFHELYPKEMSTNLGKKKALFILPTSVAELDKINQKPATIHLGKSNTFQVSYDSRAVLQSLYGGILVLPDGAIKSLHPEKYLHIQSINISNEKQAFDLSKKLEAQLSSDAGLLSYPETYRYVMNTMGVLLFIGLFIGLVFLAATGCIIYFKLLTEAYSDRETYVILKKIGVTRKEIRFSIARQVLIIFLIPLVLGIMHSSVALLCLANLIEVDLTRPVILTTVIYTLMYIIYYLLTVNSYTNIVIGKNK